MSIQRNNVRQEFSPQDFPIKKIVSLVIALGLLIVLLGVTFNFIGRNDVSTWQVKQSLNGEVTVIDEPGYYFKPFAKVWTYPRSIQTFYDDERKDNKKDETIGVTFNDGGTAKVSAMVRFGLPADKEQRLQLHRTFGNSNDCENITDAVWAHLVNTLKVSAPLMSASENQAGRKAEFNQVVEEQLRNGLYQMKIIPKIAKDQTDDKGQAITIYQTEIYLENGKPKLAQSSPLSDYGLFVTQFSITGTVYDEQTLKQFASKKESFLAAEKSKAQREQEVQQRLMTVEKGLREKAEVEAEANKEKAKVTIEAEQKVVVAAQQKLEAETVANRQLAIAEIEKKEAETKANNKLEVARIMAKAADEEAKAIKTLANAQQEKIKSGGAITDKERILAEIARDRDVQIAQHLSNIRTPNIIMNGGGTGASSEGWQSNLMNLVMLRMAGIDFNKAAEASKPTN